MTLMLVYAASGCGPGGDPQPTNLAVPGPPLRAGSTTSGEAGSAPPQPASPEVVVGISRAVEGDLLEIDAVVEGVRTVRLIGVDAPDPGQPLAEEAREFAASMTEGRSVTLVFDVARMDRYGRLLAHVRLPGDETLGELLLEKGYAQVATFPPNVSRADRFEEVQTQAREEGRGLWGLPGEDLCRLNDRGNGIGGDCPEEPPPEEPSSPPEPDAEPAPNVGSGDEAPERSTPSDPEPKPVPRAELVAEKSAQPATSGPPAVTLVGAGDVADCTGPGDEATARLLARIAGTVFTLGDNAQDAGAPAEFMDCYGPSWGVFRGRTRPAPGNHEYETAGASPYFRYFGAWAGPHGRGYYSYDRGAWHVVVLNSNCEAAGGCGPRSPQGRWLRRDLRAHPSRCTLAYFHHPLFTSSANARTPVVGPLWRALYGSGADVILSGHAHSYERFAPLDPDGGIDRVRGIRQFVVGTGGEPPLTPLEPPPAGSVVRNDRTPGVLKLDLFPGAYRWRFVPVAGKGFTDSGSARCR